MPPCLPHPILCLVTDRRQTGGRPLEEVVALGLCGGVNLVQLREKDMPSGKLMETWRCPCAASRRAGRCSSSTTGSTSPSPAAPTASSSARTRCRLVTRRRAGPGLLVSPLSPRRRGSRTSRTGRRRHAGGGHHLPVRVPPREPAQPVSSSSGGCARRSVCPTLPSAASPTATRPRRSPLALAASPSSAPSPAAKTPVLRRPRAGH